MPVASKTTLPNSVDELKAPAGALFERLGRNIEQVDHQAAQLKEQSALIEKLKFELARLRRWRFGQSAESVESEQVTIHAGGAITAMQGKGGHDVDDHFLAMAVGDHND